MASAVPAQGQTDSPPGPPTSTSRITREGKKITYQLRVLQEPVQARACGAGAKSSADRRPVDPPPVVQMNIFESDPHDDTNRTDITFAYNANFFLFATLEAARTVSQGRVAPPSCPVLTGVPVAGVAYLDRPHPGGYFIFPDLSVRHEGHYQLVFHLFEQTKDTKDASEGTPPLPPPVPGKLSAPQQFLEFRLEILSKKFQVWSAKKFPGLSMSTNCSRTIAEQGCRVRIRRDVRMRRRGEKRADGFQDSNRFATPDGFSAPAPDRPRSTSISTVDHAYAYSSQRRPSGPEYGSLSGGQPFHRQMPPTPTQASTPIPPPIAASNPVAIPPSTPSPAYAPAPLPVSAVAQPPPPNRNYLSFTSAQTHYQDPPLSHVPQPTNAPANIYSPRSSISHGRNSSTGTEYDVSSTGYSYSQSRPPAERPNYSNLPTTPLPPIARPQTPSSMITSLPPLKSLSNFPPTSSQPSSIGSSPGNDYPPVPRPWETTQTLSKRTHEETFGYDDRPLHNGMRPDADYGGAQRRPSTDGDSDSDEMTYKRANGRMISKIRSTTH
ncbi:velvet factor-domain-containing protein [Aspergillus karnatakaensis]|uniref:sexual development activator VeA n=1 Tax=Aspergillus karnatakaensis TaxID=1810916 RepID=UPI003CCCF66A